MPCYSSEGMGQSNSADVDRLKSELDKVTSILCAIMKIIPEDLLDKEALEWKREHQKFDSNKRA